MITFSRIRDYAMAGAVHTIGRNTVGGETALDRLRREGSAWPDVRAWFTENIGDPERLAAIMEALDVLEFSEYP